MSLSRRELLILVPALALADNSAEPKIQFPVRPRDRLSVTSYPFRTYIESATNRERKPDVPGMDLKEFPRFVIEKFGVYNINPLGAHFSSTDDAYLASFREAVSQAGSHLVDLGLGGVYAYDADSAARESAVEYGRKWIDIAVKVGSPSVRLHLELRRDQKADVALASEALGPLADYGAKRNIVVNLENDNARAEDPFVIVAVIEKVQNPYLRALPDFGNSLETHDAAFNERAVKAMLGHVWNMCHVKDCVEGKDGQLKTVDLARMFALAKQSGYRGYFSMEYETRAGDPITGTQRLVKKSLQYLS